MAKGTRSPDGLARSPADLVNGLRCVVVQTEVRAPAGLPGIDAE